VLDAIDSSVDMVNDGIVLLQENTPHVKTFSKLQAVRVRNARINRFITVAQGTAAAPLLPTQVVRLPCCASNSSHGPAL
jgi:hypothetical protein